MKVALPLSIAVAASAACLFWWHGVLEWEIAAVRPPPLTAEERSLVGQYSWSGIDSGEMVQLNEDRTTFLKQFGYNAGLVLYRGTWKFLDGAVVFTPPVMPPAGPGDVGYKVLRENGVTYLGAGYVKRGP
ncbi:MAG: hypothetical protein ACO1TE_11820 [Prosthecobacter sp.]